MDCCTKKNTLSETHSQQGRYRVTQKSIFSPQKNPTRGDFVKLVTNDLEVWGVTYEEVISENMTNKKL